MDFLKKINTETQYDLAKDDFEWATVSLLKDVDEVRYMTMQDKYKKEYLTFEALGNGTITFKKLNSSKHYHISNSLTTQEFTSMSYSVDNGNTWVTLTNDGTSNEQTLTVNLNAGDKVIFKGTAEQFTKYVGPGTDLMVDFEETMNVNIFGNIMSLLYGDDFVDELTVSSSQFYMLFENNTNIVSAKNLILPATTLAQYCYQNMFNGCTSLTTAPELPATTLANGCYSQMFVGCTSLTKAPELSATTLAQDCYNSMFQGCTSLTTVPVLPATTMASSCYSQMFVSCTSLKTVPTLSATTLATSCFSGMFHSCTSLTTIPSNYLPVTTLATNCYNSMFQNCTGLTTAPVLPATTLANNCYSYMFYGCTSLTTAPELPATTLAENCYNDMFQGCTSLTTAPELPATTLVNECYQGMFTYCSSLNYIKAMFTTTPTPTYTYNWVNHVAATGTFVKNSAAEWDVTDTYGIPSGWTVQTASE